MSRLLVAVHQAVRLVRVKLILVHPYPVNQAVVKDTTPRNGVRVALPYNVVVLILVALGVVPNQRRLHQKTLEPPIELRLLALHLLRL